MANSRKIILVCPLRLSRSLAGANMWDRVRQSSGSQLQKPVTLHQSSFTVVEVSARDSNYLMFLNKSEPRLPPSVTSTLASSALSSGIMGGGGP